MFIVLRFFVVAASFCAFFAAPAFANVTFCNKTNGRLDLMVGFETYDGFKTVGWFIADAGKCVVTPEIVRSDRYYVYARSFDRSLIWTGDKKACGDSFMGFEIMRADVTNCAAKRYTVYGLLELDLRSLPNRTVEFRGEIPADRVREFDRNQARTAGFLYGLGMVVDDAQHDSACREGRSPPDGKPC